MTSEAKTSAGAPPPLQTRRKWPRIAALAAVLVPILVVLCFFALTFIGVTSFVNTGGNARARGTVAALSVIKGQARAYHLEHSSYPPALNVLITAKYLESGPLLDGWGRPLNYAVNAPGSLQPFVLFSSGPDGIPGTTDDIPASWP